MNTEEGEIDEAVKRATVTKLTMEALVAAVTVLIYAKLLLTDDTKALIKARFKKWRYAFFGPPPLTEEQIHEAERQTVIEAMRVVRYES